MARDILKTLASEHEEVRTLFEELKKTTDRAEKTRARLLDQIEATLLPHAKWEELVFYPAFKERADRDGLQAHAEAVQEHRAVEHTVLPDLHAAGIDTPQFAGRAKVFAEFVDHHAREEEKTMFKMARKLFSGDERALLDEQYEAWKKSPACESAVAAEKARAGLKAAARSLRS
ncbi:hemerythrin domain-containing protein [Luteimonas vadosa]|uniref:Hemerythrin-like domain-containing protein n=1 Tax=Luteimonas vadosa TaxID=1165507 RepID=A0ABP9E1I1_9GAMM